MTFYKLTILTLTASVLVACSGEPTSSSSSSTPAPATAAAEHVEISLVDKLDGVTSSYCIDIAGGNKNIDITKGLQAHTCYSYTGTLGDDQIFATSQFTNNALYMPVYDVCAQPASLTAGAAIELAACNGSDLQKLAFSGKGTISPAAAPNMCFTAAVDTRFGKSQKHQIKKLSLEACSADLAGFQNWYARSEAE